MSPFFPIQHIDRNFAWNLKNGPTDKNRGKVSNVYENTLIK